MAAFDICYTILRAIYTRIFCIRFSVRDGATTQLLPLLFSRDHVCDRAKVVAGRRRHRGRRNRRKKRECRRPFTWQFNARAVCTPASTHLLLSAGNVPGMAASRRATLALAGANGTTSAPENNFDLELICA
jgi:hypothetical protein